MKHLLQLIISITFFIVLIYFNSNAKEKSGNKKNINKTSSVQVSSTYLDINNIKALQGNNGFSDYSLNSNLGGFEWPKGSGKLQVFISGFLWGGYVQGDPQVRVGGSTYWSGLQSGPILSNGYAADPADLKWRIFRVRPDVYPGSSAIDLASEAELENTTPEDLRSQYETDWTEWPAAGTSNDLGAPFKDVNNDGIYEPNIDIPGVPGADQTIFFVANDLDSNLTKSLYGTLPMGIEMHATYWAYAQAGELGDMYFKKYTIINKGYQHNTIDSMFVSFWVDPDIGGMSADLVGTDNNNPPNLVYTYKGVPSDPLYSLPPSIGFALLKGPEVNKQALLLYASYTFQSPTSGGDVNFFDPDLGQSSGSTQFYNFFNGLTRVGSPVINPITNQHSKFIFNGDPVTKTGWIDGTWFSTRDVRQGISSGPFTFAPGDTQVVAFAEMIGQGSDYLHSIYMVKNKLYSYADEAYKNNTTFPTPTAP